jgi:hypothetical protein
MRRVFILIAACLVLSAQQRSYTYEEDQRAARINYSVWLGSNDEKWDAPVTANCRGQNYENLFLIHKTSWDKSSTDLWMQEAQKWREMGYQRVIFVQPPKPRDPKSRLIPIEYGVGKKKTVTKYFLYYTEAL